MVMLRYLKSTIMVVAGLCWLAAALLFGLFLLQYLAGDNGFQIFSLLFGIPVMAVLGVAHVFGIIAAMFICFVIGVGLCVHGLVPAPESPTISTPPRQQLYLFLRNFLKKLNTPPDPVSQFDDSEHWLRCVRCNKALAEPVHICPTCGWTQPH
jgi:hypothetical protein